MTVSPLQIAAFRLRQHHLAERRSSDLVAICRDVCGIQAQVMGAARLALWARAARVVRQDIDSLLWDKRLLIKTTAMRQTMHLLPADEYYIYLAAIRHSRMDALMRVMARLSITQKEVDAMNAILLEILGNHPLPQLELARQIKPRLSRKLHTWMKLSWSVFRPAIVAGLVCYGPQRGSQSTLVRVDRWLQPLPQISAEEAQRILLRKFLRAYGPAGIRDFCKWSGIPIGEARPVWASLSDELVEVSIEGAKAFILRENLHQLETSKLARTIVRLLPSFDPYMLAHADKDHLVHPRYYKRVYRNQGWLSPVILVNGRVVGIWSRNHASTKPFLRTELFEKLPKTVLKEIEEEAERLKQFGKSCQLSL